MDRMVIEARDRYSQTLSPRQERNKQRALFVEDMQKKVDKLDKSSLRADVEQMLWHLAHAYNEQSARSRARCVARVRLSDQRLKLARADRRNRAAADMEKSATFNTLRPFYKRQAERNALLAGFKEN